VCFGKQAKPRGSDHHSWKGDLTITPDLRTRKLYPIVEGQECERCPALATVRHHTDRNQFNNHPSNIEFLCQSCHIKEHWAAGDIRPKVGSSAPVR
jgi:hypothetical protein